MTNGEHDRMLDQAKIVLDSTPAYVSKLIAAINRQTVAICMMTAANSGIITNSDLEASIINITQDCGYSSI